LELPVLSIEEASLGFASSCSYVEFEPSDLLPNSSMKCKRYCMEKTEELPAWSRFYKWQFKRSTVMLYLAEYLPTI